MVLNVSNAIGIIFVWYGIYKCLISQWTMESKINVKGMHCKSCDMLVEDSLGDLKGVKSVQSLHKEGFVEVDFDESIINIDKIKKTIIAEGYEVN